MAAALLGAGLLLAQACMPLPPPFRRVPMPASVLGPGEASGALHYGFNAQGVGARRNYGEFQANGIDTTGQEGSFYTRIGMPRGFEAQLGVGGPDLIPYAGLRYALLGAERPRGPFLTLESGLTAVPDLHGGIALGAALGSVEPYVALRAGNYASLKEHPYYEEAAGLAWRWDGGRVIAQYGGRQDGLDSHALAQGAALALELTAPAGGHAKAEAAAASQKLADGDPCSPMRPQNVYEPGQWEAYADCQGKMDNAGGAARSRGFAKQLRAKPTIR
jgi:hypothetical protein